TRQWVVPLPPPYAEVVSAWFSTEMRISWPCGWWMPTAELGVPPLRSQPEKNGLEAVGTAELSCTRVKSLVERVARRVAPDCEWLAMLLLIDVPLAVDPIVREVALW